MNTPRTGYRTLAENERIKHAAQDAPQSVSIHPSAPDLAAPPTPMFVLKPMATAPRPGPTEYTKLLVLDEWTESGQPVRGWSFVYWIDAFDGRPAGWHGRDCGDLRHPLGWILSTAELPAFPS